MARGSSQGAKALIPIADSPRIGGAPATGQTRATSLAAEEIAACACLLDCLRIQARALLQIYETDPRGAAVMATQQRWLLAHAAFALYCETGGRGFTPGRFFERVARHRLASRNTADAFIKNLLNYGMVRQVAGEDRRSRPVVPTESTVQAMESWISIHLATLDGLDQGGRLQRFRSSDNAITRLHPSIAEGLLSSEPIRQPPTKTFSLFIWLDNGGLIMERLISSLHDPVGGSDRIGTEVFSTGGMARWLKLSRSHLNRKLREAERLKSIGWDGDRRNSPMWISRGFLKEIMDFQAAKLAVIDAAFTAVFGPAD